MGLEVLSDMSEDAIARVYGRDGELLEEGTEAITA